MPPGRLGAFLVIAYASSMAASLDRLNNAVTAVFPPSLGFVLARRAAAGASEKGGLGRGTMFAQHAPEAFAAAWLCFGAMPAAFHARS